MQLIRLTISKTRQIKRKLLYRIVKLEL